MNWFGKAAKSVCALALAASSVSVYAIKSVAAQGQPGVTIAENTDYPDSDAPYQVTFKYKASEEAESVSLVGGFTFYTEDQLDDYVNGDPIAYKTPYEYKEGMFPTGYAVSEYGYAPIEMEKDEEGLYSVTLPLPGFEYFYGFAENGDLSKIAKDPTNMPFENNGKDSGWSLLWVGDKDHCIEGQEYVYPRSDGNTGEVTFLDYADVNGDTQTIGVYTPYGYDASKEYKTLYICHGGGGNEVEWFHIGAAKNIFDNLIAEGEVEPTVVVSMNNTVYNFERGPSVENIVTKIIPLVEEKFAVSKSPQDRAIAGLSSGASVTVQALLYNVDAFNYYGIWSPSRTLDFVNETLTDEMKEGFLKPQNIYVSVGIYDSFVRRNVNVQIDEVLEEVGASHEFFWKKGAHDWGVWRSQLTEFAKDYLWEKEAEEGVVVTENVDFPDVPVASQATFAFKAPEGTTSVALFGNFQFYAKEDVAAFQNGEDVPVHMPWEYEEGMYNTGYQVSGAGGYAQIPMKKGLGNVYTLTIPLPSTEYCYQFAATDEEGNVTNYKDPTNMPVANEDSDSGWSLLWVGDAESAIAGQEYIYPCDKQGTVEYISFTALNGTTQPLGVYLPYGYDEAGSYPTLYLSHGGGGNEVEWFNIGSAANIFDNLIAEGSLEPTMIVTMDFSVLGFTSDEGHKNLVEVIIPLIEEKYAASSDPADRAIAGLSAGGQAAAKAMVDEPEVFKYFGVWSPRAVGVLGLVDGKPSATEEQLAGLKDAYLYYVSVGEYDIDIRRQTELDLVETLRANGAENVVFTWANGAHDWGVWRQQLTDFAKNHLWKYDPPGFTGFKLEDGTPFAFLNAKDDLFWFEDGQQQGIPGDKKNIWDTQYDKTERGREIYDPNTDSWYWLDANKNGAVAKDKEVWMPYVFQDEEPGSTDGKWVRYDRYGQMIKGWYANDDGVYYYDQKTGAMYKGTHVINNKTYVFDEVTGIRK